MRLCPPEITDDRARKVYRETAKTLEADKRLDDSTYQLVLDLALLEQIKWANQKRGETGAVLRCVEQQRKIRRELKLTPASGLVPESADGDDFEDF